MLKVTTPVMVLLAPFAGCFNEPVHATFCLMVVAWVACLGRRTLSRVWQTTGRAADCDHSKAYRLFNQAAWNWDDLARVSLLELLADLLPGSSVWLVVDDTLCHKRVARVAFGGLFLDAVLSSKKHKTFRFGVNWVTLGVAIRLPFRPDRPFCVNLLWRVYSKKVKGLPHQTKSQLARQMVELVATWLPDRAVYVVADSAYMGKHLLKGVPGHVHSNGPLQPQPHPPSGQPEQAGAPRYPRQPQEGGAVAQANAAAARPPVPGQGPGVDVAQRAEEEAAGQGDPGGVLVSGVGAKGGPAGAGT